MYVVQACECGCPRRSTQGNEADVHNVHWHGLVFEWDGAHVDQFNLLPSTSTSAQLVADNPGTWLLHCHVRRFPSRLSTTSGH